MKNVAVIALTVLNVSCVTTLTKEGQNVRAFNGSVAENCSFLGNVRGSSSGGATPSHDQENARNELYNKTGKLGGNFVRITSESSNIWTSIVMGEAYSCPSSTRIVTEPIPVQIVPNQQSAQQPGHKSYNQIQREVGEAFGSDRNQCYPGQKCQVDSDCNQNACNLICRSVDKFGSDKRCVMN